MLSTAAKKLREGCSALVGLRDQNAKNESPPLHHQGWLWLVPEAGIEPAHLSARDFLTTSTFAATLLTAGCSWSGARLHHSLAAVGARRLLSTPSQTFAWAWLGVGSATKAARAFAEFDGRHFEGFPSKAQIFKSLVSTDFTTRAECSLL